MPKTRKNSKKSKLKKSKKVKIMNNKITNFIHKELKNENVIILDYKNRDKIEYENPDFQEFFNKLIEILNFSFEKEREYHISKGSYYPGYKHNLDTIKNNVHSNNFETYILTDKKLVPISMLYVEKNEDDYDKIWTVCTDRNYRGKGMSSKLINFMIVNQLNNENSDRNDMLLEVYNDHIISREDNDVKQSQIMGLFGSKGFKQKNPKTLSDYSYNNLLSNDGQTKIMVFDRNEWRKKNRGEYRKLKFPARKLFSINN